MLERGAAEDDAASLVELAVWQLEGVYVRRDLRRSRECFGRAAELGDASAERIFISLLANGIGGDQNWISATARLRAFAAGDDLARRQLSLLDAMALRNDGYPAQVPEPRPLSSRPNVSAIEGLLTGDECQYLIDIAGPLLEPSVIVDPASGQLRPHPVRTSEGAAFPLVSEDLVISALNRRVAAASNTDHGAGEPLQVLRYTPGQEYRPHLDALPVGDNQRIVTVLLYLNDGYRGGETLFTHTGLKFQGRRGDALLFRNALPDGSPDPMSKHAGLPVVSGEKYLATRWIHERPMLVG